MLAADSPSRCRRWRTSRTGTIEVARLSSWYTSPTSANRGASTPRMGADRMSTIAYSAEAASDRARTSATSSRRTFRFGRPC
jgi:hypothetical protein